MLLGCKFGRGNLLVGLNLRQDLCRFLFLMKELAVLPTALSDFLVVTRLGSECARNAGFAGKENSSIRY